MSESQNHTVDLYYSMLHTNALAHCLRWAHERGLVTALRNGQRDLHGLAEITGQSTIHLQPILQVLVAVGFIEQYDEDFALSQAARLMEGIDRALADPLYSSMHNSPTANPLHEPANLRELLSLRQWTHTAAAMQAAEVLDLSQARSGSHVLCLGAGTGVWIGAMAYSDPSIRITVVDDQTSLSNASLTLASIDVHTRINQIVGDYRRWDVPLDSFDLVLLPEVLQLEDDPNAVILLGRAADALHDNGEVVILEPLLESDGPPLPLAVHQLEIALASPGKMRSTQQIQRLLHGAGFGDAQWGWLTASHQGIGLVLAAKSPT